MKMKGLAVWTVIALVAFGIVICSQTNIGVENAAIRAEEFAKAVNDNNPKKVYEYLAPGIRDMASREVFVQNFAKERSYPYLTPLYLYVEDVQLCEGETKGVVNCIVASRLPGEKMEFEIVFIEDDYYICGFEEIADGSFIDKFKKLK